MTLEQLWQYDTRFVRASTSRPRFGSYAVPHRLAQQRVRLFLADEAEQVPRPIGQHDAMDFRFIFDRSQDVVQSIIGRTFGERREGPLGFSDVLSMNRFPERFSAYFAARGCFGLHQMQHFFLSPTFFLNAICVSIQHLKHREWLELRRQLAG